jgi:hypothetical protein
MRSREGGGGARIVRRGSAVVRRRRRCGHGHAGGPQEARDEVVPRLEPHRVRQKRSRTHLPHLPCFSSADAVLYEAPNACGCFAVRRAPWLLSPSVNFVSCKGDRTCHLETSGVITRMTSSFPFCHRAMDAAHLLATMLTRH